MQIDTSAMPCAGDAYEPTIYGLTFPQPTCYWCKKSYINGGKCLGDNWTLVKVESEE